MFDKKLRSSGNGSIAWGLLNVAIGGVLVSGHHLSGLVSLSFGAALVIEGFYERKVRDPKVIIVSTATLAALSLLHFSSIVLAAVNKTSLAFGGRSIYWAIAEAAGAYNTWKTYAVYQKLRDESDPAVVQEISSNLDELKKAKPDQSLDLIQFDVNSGFGSATKRYRLKPMEDLYLIADYKMQFSSMILDGITFVPRNEVSLVSEGDKWMSKKIKASVQLGPLKLEKVTITPDMAARIDPAAGVMAYGVTY
jgi:hypothetical protein